MTEIQKSDGAILKTDARGRVQTPAARRESLLDEFERRGLSGAKFAALAGIKYQTFAAWSLRRRKLAGVQAPAQPAHPVRWLEAVVDQAHGVIAAKASSLALHLPGGARMDLADAAQLPLAAALLRSLETSC
jgi:cellulase/cellobiase CelA1